MKIKSKIYLSIAIFIISILALTNKVDADSYLKLNNLEFEATINEDATMDVIEYWDIKIEETNTLYKYFETDKDRFSGITDVKVTEITNGQNRVFTKVNNWAYHVTKNCYYGARNEEGNFEIGWGVGLDNSSATRQYKIEYTVKDAVSKNNDYAELYWQFIGKGFEVPAKKVTGTIILPDSTESKEDIKVWGHTEGLNGTIYATDVNKVEFNLDGYNSGNMVEVRVLFPTEMINSSARESSKNILQSVIDEETEWVEAANRRREIREYGSMVVVLIITIILDIILLRSIKKYNIKLKEVKDAKFVPELEIEYFRDIPRNNATPGEAYKLINKTIEEISSTSIGKIFSAGLLDLSLKGFVEFKINDTKNEKEKVSIIVIGKNEEELETIGEEKVIYNFLKQIKNSENGITVKQLQKYISNHSSKVVKLVKDINSKVKQELENNKLVDKVKEKEYRKYIDSTILCALPIIFLVPVFFVMLALYTNFIAYISLVITIILSIIAISKCVRIYKNINIFTQKAINEIEKWKGLKKFMEDYSSLDEKEVPEITIWEKYLVFATVFDIADKVIKQLKLVYPNFDEISTINSTTLYVAMHTNFSSSFSNAISTSISSTYSSSTGGGGGFSGGGGGGRWPVAAVADAK